MKWCVQSQLNLRQSLHNYSSSLSLNSYWSLVSSAALNKNLGPVIWKWGRRELTGRYLLAMLDEASNCPWPCKANLHAASFSSPSPLWCLFILPSHHYNLRAVPFEKDTAWVISRHFTNKEYIPFVLETTFFSLAVFKKVIGTMFIKWLWIVLTGAPLVLLLGAKSHFLKGF